MYNKKMTIVLVNEQSPLKCMQVLLIRFVIESVCIHHTRIGFHASQQVGGLYQRMLVDILLYRVLIAFRYRYVFVAHYYAQAVNGISLRHVDNE